MMSFISLYGDDDTAMRRKAGASNDRGRRIMGTLRRISERGPAENRIVSSILTAANRRPHTLPPVLSYLSNYERARQYLDARGQPVDAAA